MFETYVRKYDARAESRLPIDLIIIASEHQSKRFQEEVFEGNGRRKGGGGGGMGGKQKNTFIYLRFRIRMAE